MYNIHVDTSDTPLGITKEGNIMPAVYKLEQNYPNPFNPSTRIDYSVPKSTFVKLAVYDVLGREIEELVNGYITAGEYSVVLDASKLSSGLYFYKLEAGNFTKTRKMVLLK